MKVVRVVMLTREHAVLHLRPSWWRRLLGAQSLVCELEYEYPFWVSKYTRERLGFLPHSGIIRAAMECYPLDTPDGWAQGSDETVLPRATLLKE